MLFSESALYYFIDPAKQQYLTATLRLVGTKIWGGSRTANMSLTV